MLKFIRNVKQKCLEIKINSHFFLRNVLRDFHSLLGYYVRKVFTNFFIFQVKIPSGANVFIKFWFIALC